MSTKGEGESKILEILSDNVVYGCPEVPEYDWYGFYGHQRNVSRYEQIMREDYARWTYAPYVPDVIRNEVEQCRENVALFDLSSFGKVKGHIYLTFSLKIPTFY